MLELFILKAVDIFIASFKTIFTIRGKKLLAASAQAISNVFYITLMSKLMKATDWQSILVTSLAVFIGQYMSQTVAEKLNKEKIYKVSGTAKTVALGQSVIESLRERDVNFRVLEAQGRHSKALAIDIFCCTKEETKIAKSILDSYSVKHYTVELKAIAD